MRIFYFILIIIIINNFQFNTDIESTTNWFYNFTDNNYLMYEYDLKSKLIFDNDIKPSLRKLSSTWILSKYYQYCLKKYNFNNANKVKKFIIKGIEYFKNFIIKKNNNYWFTNTNLGCLAFYMMVINNLNLDDDNYINFYNSLLNSQIIQGKNKGAFYTNWNNDTINDDIRYIPCQILLAFLNHYNKYKNKYLLNRIIIGLNYYNKIKNKISIPWLIQPNYQIFLITKNKIYADIVFELGDILIKYNMLMFDTNIVNMSVGTWMEGLTDCYKLALNVNDKDRIIKYKKALLIGKKNMEKLKVKSNIKLINNGFTESYNVKRLRIDWNQHALHFYLKYYT